METSCGLFSWRPRGLQRFANHRFYLGMYSVVSVVMGVIYSYLSVVLTTVEKHFGIQSRVRHSSRYSNLPFVVSLHMSFTYSQEAAWIYSGNEISQIFFIVFLPLVGRVKKRPLFMGLALCLSAFGLILMALPNFSSSSAEKIRVRALNNTPEKQQLCG